MTTYKLTLKQPHPVSGFRNSCLGWHFTMATAMDALEGAIFVQKRADWDWMIFPNPDNRNNQRMSLTKSVKPQGISTQVQLIVDTPQWFVLDTDTDFVRIIDQDVVAASYDVEVWLPPLPPPPPPEPEPEPEPEPSQDDPQEDEGTQQ